jgi:hypothetical protein
LNQNAQSQLTCTVHDEQDRPDGVCEPDNFKLPGSFFIQIKS